MPHPTRIPLAAALALTTTACPGGDVAARKALRTAEAPVTIVRVDTVTSYDADMIEETRHRVVWRFDVDGRTVTDSLAGTRYVEGEAYKVCYDPADPANSTLELADIACTRAP